jgi:hypothetical protein
VKTKRTKKKLVRSKVLFEIPQEFESFADEILEQVTIDLPVRYSTLRDAAKRLVRNEYIRRQRGICPFCMESFDKFSPGLLRPCLHHNYKTDMTICVLHSYCNLFGEPKIYRKRNWEPPASFWREQWRERKKMICIANAAKQASWGARFTSHLTNMYAMAYMLVRSARRFADKK